MAIPQKVDRRILEGIHRYRPILEQAKARDVNEAGTVTTAVRSTAIMKAEQRS
jgi:hypothetical protein